MSILIGADIVPTESNKFFFDSGNMQDVVGVELLKILSKSNYRIFNLECPLVNADSPIQKCGPNLRAEVSIVKGLKAIGVDLLTLANNHIMDHGNAGLKSTISVLEKKGISFLGAGSNLKVAAMPFIIAVNNNKIGIYACTEHEFSIAECNKPGANPFDPLESFDHVVDLKKGCDFVIVLYHGGKEHFRYPSPILQRVCRKFVEKGADLVVCQHSHCIGCEEKYHSGTIVYGQGNFIFDSCNTPTSQTSLLLKIDDNFKIDYIPLEKCGCGVRLAKDASAKKILSDFFERSELIKKARFIEDEYSRFAKKMVNSYLLTCSGYRHKYALRLLNKLCGYKLTEFMVKRFKKDEILAIRNFLECEAHRELFLEGLKK
jgi:poly-gamma-glutamate synthesis protein (capsule biosynthesis protein)